MKITQDNFYTKETRKKLDTLLMRIKTEMIMLLNEHEFEPAGLQNSVGISLLANLLCDFMFNSSDKKDLRSLYDSVFKEMNDVYEINIDRYYDKKTLQ